MFVRGKCEDRREGGVVVDIVINTVLGGDVRADCASFRVVECNKEPDAVSIFELSESG